MTSLHRAFLHFCLWQMRTEHMIGSSTGMNPIYLANLSASISRMEGDLLRLEINHG